MSQAANLSKELLNEYNISNDDLQKMVSDAVTYFLVADQKKSIIRKADLVKACDLTRRDRKLQDPIIKLAALHLNNIFGIEVRDLSKTSTYILVNKLSEINVGEFLNWSDREAAHMGLTFIILALILMNNDRINEEALFDFLRTLGVYDDGTTHIRGGNPQIEEEVLELFDGDLRKFVNETLVSRQHYLKKERVVQNEESEQYFYLWGDRAEAEVKPSMVFKMVCGVFKCEPSMFKEQFDRIRQRENLSEEDFALQDQSDK
eukprot:TRINITY_DN4445_c0_g1_i1.p1 TRINITY_DN4445_c0_g1~~TRINITY_DN4445_c0_g1_i1.p1  ORF type:complete len:261 (+),score=91.20 TRINITY_DN4445_c0_g1_i1:53-835(+)